ncbi:hypothetical protein B0A50_08537 [Salinomyces thailandicus]|uniref:Uncharacterized protein n=1 Tax=Salinomyces thailandicus TaxID=706561 RepID=A0A4U0TK19_9PEZI|nr:hypothetical protein B0A50_08537 [Salinomyces thailandica]
MIVAKISRDCWYRVRLYNGLGGGSLAVPSRRSSPVNEALSHLLDLLASALSDAQHVHVMNDVELSEGGGVDVLYLYGEGGIRSGSDGLSNADCELIGKSVGWTRKG